MTNENMTQPQKAYRLSREIADYTHRQRTIAKLKRSQVRFPSQPTYIPHEWQDEEGDFKMPEDITNLEYSQLGQLLSTLNALLQWYGAVTASSKIDKLTAERVKNFTESKVRMEILSDEQMKKDYKAREDKDAYVNINDLVQQAQDWYDAQESLVIMSEQLYKDYDRAFQLVSREITRRGNEGNRDFREGNLK